MPEISGEFQKIKEEIAAEADRLRTVQPSPDEFKMPVIYCDLLKPSGRIFIEELYRKILNRTPDAKELEMYSDGLSSGKMSKEFIVQSVALSDEAVSNNIEVNAIRAEEVYGKLLLKFDGALFVEKAYKWLLGRKPEPEAVADNLDRMKCGVSKADVLRSIGGSIECNNRGTRLVGLDEETVNEQAGHRSGVMMKLKRAAIKIKRRIFG